MKKFKNLLLLLLFLLVGCTNKAKIHNINYDTFINKINNNENFIITIINKKDNNYIGFNTNIKSIVNNYNINIYSLNINKLTNKQIKKLKKIINYEKTPTLTFINDGIEEDITNRIEGNINIDIMIEKFKKAKYID